MVRTPDDDKIAFTQFFLGPLPSFWAGSSRSSSSSEAAAAAFLAFTAFLAALTTFLAAAYLSSLPTPCSLSSCLIFWAALLAFPSLPLPWPLPGFSSSESESDSWASVAAAFLAFTAFLAALTIFLAAAYLSSLLTPCSLSVCLNF